MKKPAVLFAIGVVAAVALVVYWLGKRQTGAPQESTKPIVEASKTPQTVPAEINSSPESATQTQRELSARALKDDPSRSNELLQATQQAYAKAIKLHPGQILASVNGVPITLRDLVPTDPSESTDTERSMSEDHYKFLLNRAIERELAFQAGQREGIALSQDQQAQLDQIERSTRGRDAGQSEDVLAHLNRTASLETEIEFEKRDAAGLLTQEALLEHSGGPPAHVTEDMVKEYYENNIKLYGPLPASPEERDAAWRQIDAQIRTDLKDAVLQAHQDGLQNNMDRLKANAVIETSDVKSQPAKPAGQ